VLWFRLSIICVFSVSLDHFVPVLLAFVVLSLVFSVPSKEIGWQERLSSGLNVDYRSTGEIWKVICWLNILQYDITISTDDFHFCFYALFMVFCLPC